MLVIALKQYIDRLAESASPKAMFPDVPTLRFTPDIEACSDCAKKLTVLKTRFKTVVSLAIGKFRAYEIILGCKECENTATYCSEELLRLVPPRCQFGYDILVYVGRSLFFRCRNETEIHSELEDKGISISTSEIAYLAKKFIAYLALAHQESREEIRNFMSLEGGYILHLDATSDGDSPHLMSGLDGMSELVLENIKLPSEKKDKIIPFLRDIKKLYGNPRALVHDMGVGILGAVKEVFPDTPDYICHFHFLRDIGKDLFGEENDKLRARLRKLGIQGVLRKRAREFKQIIEGNPSLVDAFQASLKKKKLDGQCMDQIPVVTAYSLILWALEGKNDGQGYGFPFDRSHLTFYQRLKTIYDKLEKINQLRQTKDRRVNKPYVKIIRDLSNTMTDMVLAKTATQMQEKTIVFDKLREAMRITLTDSKAGLNDHGESSELHTIENRVKKFHHWLSNEQTLSLNDGYKKMSMQIEKYWDKLFAAPIIVDTPRGKVTIQPQRTNNLLERFFREIKRGYRRRKGINTLSNTLKAMLSDTPLVKNLQNKNYLKIILNGKSSLEERFAQIDANLVRHKLIQAQADRDFASPRIKRLVKNPGFIDDISFVFAG